MNHEKLLKKYTPMTETAFYILLSFMHKRHGYEVIRHVAELTNGRIKLGAGTMYGTITKMQKDELIQYLHEDEKRKFYQITDLGKVILKVETLRIKELYHNLEGLSWGN